MTGRKDPLVLCGLELGGFMLCCGLGGLGWIASGNVPVGAAILFVYFGATMIFSFLAGFFTGGLAVLLLLPVHFVAALVSSGLLYWRLSCATDRK